MIEPEMAFCDLEGDMDLAEELVKYLVRDIREKCPTSWAFRQIRRQGIARPARFCPRAALSTAQLHRAVELLRKSGEKFEFPVEYGLNLQSEHERWLTEKHFKSPLTVFNYPKEIKPFYMRLNDDGKTVTAMDLLVPGIGEIVGGSQREERLDVLEENLRRHKMNLADYRWYLDLRATAPCRMPASALALSACSCSSPASQISATSSPSLAPGQRGILIVA
jgi:asparaginyl-tRNA synthetase